MNFKNIIDYRKSDLKGGLCRQRDDINRATSVDLERRLLLSCDRANFWGCNKQTWKKSSMIRREVAAVLVVRFTDAPQTLSSSVLYNMKAVGRVAQSV
jgi:hypothetical protein